MALVTYWARTSRTESECKMNKVPNDKKIICCASSGEGNGMMNDWFILLDENCM